MKIYEHRIGRQRVRSQFEDEATVQEMFDQFVPNFLFHAFKIKNFNPETMDLPKINGAGFRFRDKLYTVFAEGNDILFLDGEGVKEMAQKVPEPEKKPEEDMQN